MIEEADQRLQEWVVGCCGQVDVSLAAPEDAKTGHGVALYLMDFVQAATPRAAARPRPKLWMRYLVTTWAETPPEAHRLMGDLLLKALDEPEFEVEPDPVAAELWLAFRIRPRPAFVLRVPVVQERVEKPVQLVTKPLVIKEALLTSLSGKVLGPGDMAIMGAWVELPTLNLRTQTDFNGRFHFAVVPTNPPLKQVTVNARGRADVVVSAEEAISSDKLLIIKLKESEI
jgi:hypothetical protein